MTHAFIIRPQHFQQFENESDQMDKCKQWGLLSGKASKMKEFYYKGYGANLACNIVGWADQLTAVIEFENKEQHCIHPSYLKEMQASSFSQRATNLTESNKSEISKEPDAKTAEVNVAPKKATSHKIELPEEKVQMTATIQEFTTVPNHFSDDDDEVIIYTAVSVLEPELSLDTAWSSHSKTMKKLELEIGDILSFEAKVVKKKLTKHPVPYKINNPSKIKRGNS